MTMTAESSGTGVGALAVACLALVLGGAPRAAAQTAEELLDAHAEALGGKDALASVKALRRSGATWFDSSFTGRLAGRLEMEIVVGKKVYRSSDMGMFTSTTAWDGESAWEQGPQGLRELAGDELRLIRGSSRPFFSAGLALPEGAVATREEDRDVDGVAHRVVAIDDGEGGRITVLLHPDTHLATRVVYRADLPNLGPTEIVEERSDYAAHDGILFPGRIQVSVPGIFSTETVFDVTAIDPEIDPTRFDAPR
jgi:hypothetical protein